MVRLVIIGASVLSVTRLVDGSLPVTTEQQGETFGNPDVGRAATLLETRLLTAVARRPSHPSWSWRTKT
jgi:hypothetical protein